ncbi:SVSP family protein [Theileria parva strain Muguga]|uniref:Theileria-specific sub-telomeric protein, SVSP family n=1 Tax=Theileria parva TaxID=5875 RepID=Q4N9U1_THEPA|nr:SVSP family protein [Theileria parva strain Muguga]EAN33250.1 SVSP family protein [Theileria parva strain Muguga]|eukprot:XP_765533.1 hypothetical protein [Theileria parva strain Muguga]
MNILLSYICIIFIIIGYVHCADKPTNLPAGGHGNEDDSDESENYNLIVKGIENILEDDDDKAAGETVVSDNLMKHGLGPLTNQGYIPPFPYQPQADSYSNYYQSNDFGYVSESGKYECTHYKPQYPLHQQNLLPPVIYPPPSFQPIFVPHPPQTILIQPQPQVIPSPVTYIGYPYQSYAPPNQQKVSYIPTTKPVRVEKPKPDQLVGDKPSKDKDETKEQSSQPTEPSGTDQHLQPEHIPVEVGSDDEETEEGAVGGAGGGDEDEEDFGKEKKKEKDLEGKKSKDIKKCESIEFLKKNAREEFVKMDIFDYDIDFNDSNVIMYRFWLSPSEVRCDGKTVWKRINKNYRPKSMTYNKRYNTFSIRFKNVFLLETLVGDIWEGCVFKYPNYARLYAQDSEGNLVLLTEADYYLDVTPKGHYKFDVDGLKCVRVEFKIEGVVWEKKPGDKYPVIICLTERSGIIMYFEGETFIYGRRGGKFKLLTCRKNRRISYAK